MTREEAKNWLTKLYVRTDITDEYGDMEDMQPYEEALEIAIKALEQEPCNTDACKVVKAYMNEWDKTNNSDAISRQAVLGKIKEVCFSREQKWVDFRVAQGSNGQRDLIINFIEMLSPVTPQPKTEWIPVSERLPEEGVWVLVSVYTCHDGENAPHRAVARMRKGITEQERKELEKRGDERALWFYPCDEWGNNGVNYNWDTWGSDEYWGQDVEAWMPLPDPYKAESEDEE